jgi:predicted kinase
VRLIVIAGPACSGKMPLARALMEQDPSLVLVHRDALRDAFVARFDEWILTVVMADIVDRLLLYGQNVITVSWNLTRDDRRLWKSIAKKYHYDRLELEWLDTRTPEAHALIPPLEGWTPTTMEQA